MMVWVGWVGCGVVGLGCGVGGVELEGCGGVTCGGNEGSGRLGWVRRG